MPIYHSRLNIITCNRNETISQILHSSILTNVNKDKPILCISCGQYSTTNFRCDVSAFDLRRPKHRLLNIDVLTFEYRCVALRRSMSRCVDLRRWMCRLSKIDESTFGDGLVDLRRPMTDVSMCRPSKIGD